MGLELPENIARKPNRLFPSHFGGFQVPPSRLGSSHLTSSPFKPWRGTLGVRHEKIKILPLPLIGRTLISIPILSVRSIPRRLQPIEMFLGSAPNQ